MRRLLQEAAELSRTLDLIVATQGSDSPAVAPIIQQLSSLHRVLEDVYEETARYRGPDIGSAPNNDSSDLQRLEGRLDHAEERFGDLKDSVAQLVRMLAKTGGAQAPAPNGKSGPKKRMSPLRTANSPS